MNTILLGIIAIALFPIAAYVVVVALWTVLAIFAEILR